MRKKLLIIGTGFSGLAAAIKLKQQGEDDFLLLERSSEIGGVWRENAYPGCACDVPSHLYSFSYASNPDWSHYFARREEIHQYLKDCVKRFQLDGKICFGQEMLRAEWNESLCEWQVQTTDSVYHARFLVMAAGHLSEAQIPSLPGLETFSGNVFHSAHWPTDFIAKGRKVVVVGTGASAVQFIPQLQKIAKLVTVFQRTPAWILPRNDYAISSLKRKFFRMLPLLQKLVRLRIYLKLEFAVVAFLHPHLMKKAQERALAHLYSQIPDAKMRNLLTPNYIMGCKRILLSDDFYPALNQGNVSLVTGEIQKVQSDGVVDSAGIFHSADAIIFGTGFKTQEFPAAGKIFSRSVSLSQAWKDSPKAYLGMMVSGFPNLFLMNGPNTGLGHSSMVYMYEAMAEQLSKTLKYMKTVDVDVFEVRSSAQDDYNQKIVGRMRSTVWETGGCQSWYLNNKGNNISLWPEYSFRFRQLLAKFRPDAFDLRKCSLK